MNLAKILLVVFIFWLTVFSAEAKLLENPEAVKYAKFLVSKSGSVFLEAEGPFARCDSIDIQLSIPQETPGQKTVLKSVDGPEDYNFSLDKWGNRVMHLHWKDPPVGKELKYTVTFEVEVYNVEEKAPGKSFPLTELIKPSETIKKTAYSIAGKARDIETVLKLAKWVYDYVDYDKKYEGLNKSAQWVFENKKAVCDGHANLLISMLRALGYNAYYVMGYAYTEETPGTYWGPHGWVEVEYGNRLVTVDPTWLESPVDATHIKFSNAPDSNYSEYMWFTGVQIKPKWYRDQIPVIELLEKRESPRIRISETLLPEKLSGDAYGLLMIDVSPNLPDNCVLTDVTLTSCSDMDGNPFLDTDSSSKTLAFCGKQTLAWLLKSPPIEKGVSYICPVIVSGGGLVDNFTVRVEPTKTRVNMYLNTPSVFSLGEGFSVTALLFNKELHSIDIGIYLLFNDVVANRTVHLKPYESKKISFRLTAPQTPGNYSLVLFSSTGNAVIKYITVLQKRKIRLQNVTIPESIIAGETVNITLTLLGIENTKGIAELKWNNHLAKKEFFIRKGKTKTLVFPYTPEKPEINYINIDVFSENGVYEDGVVLTVNVNKKENDIIEKIIAEIRKFFIWLISIIEAWVQG